MENHLGTQRYSRISGNQFISSRRSRIASSLLTMSWLDMLLNEGERAARLRSDLPYFAEHCLKLRPKTGSLAPFLFNPAQLELHRRIEEQKAKTGRVRVIILKARQLGISTYVSARFFHRCLFEPGLRTFILGHERRASTNLFEMVKRFYEHLPEGVRPATGTFNAETLLFNNDCQRRHTRRRRTISYSAVA